MMSKKDLPIHKKLPDMAVKLLGYSLKSVKKLSSFINSVESNGIANLKD
jgi:hypothetical protein